MPRTARSRTRTGVYHIVVQGPDAAAVFQTDEAKAKYLEIFQYYQGRDLMKIYAFCILPNSAHFLIEETGTTISDIMRVVGISYVRWYNKTYTRTGRLFRDRYASEAIRSSSEVLRIVRFIHQLPVRYGYVNSMDAYVWSSYNAYLKGSRTLAIDASMGGLGTYNYERYMTNSWRDLFLAEKMPRVRHIPKPQNGGKTNEAKGSGGENDQQGADD